MKTDVLIIGAGPAGASAALTLRHRNKTVAVVANAPESSSLYKAPLIANYPGVKLTGPEFQQALLDQMAEEGVELIHGRALSVMNLGETFGIAVGNDFHEATAVIIAAGITRESAYKGENEYVGKGVSYCATCDGMLYKGKNVAVIGTSSEAREDMEFLRSIGCNVLELTGSEGIEIRGEDKVTSIVAGGEEHEVACVFILKDTISLSKLVQGLEYSNGAIVVDSNMATNIPGIFAAGDCVGKPYQVGKAAGDGNVAALSASSYVENKADPARCRLPSWSSWMPNWAAPSPSARSMWMRSRSWQTASASPAFPLC